MNTRHPVTSCYRQILIAALISSGSLLAVLPALADQNSPTAGSKIENQATGVFTDATDNSTVSVVSDLVTVTVAEIAGISATTAGIVPQTGTSGAYRTNTVYFDFYVYNQGNDQSQLFIPATVSSATYNNGTALPSGSIGQLSVIEYKGSPTATAVSITTGNLVDTTNGSATGTLAGLTANNGGSVAPGGYVKVRVPVTIPLAATTGQDLSVTLGNMASGQATNTPWVSGGSGGTGNDLYTQVNADGTNGKTGTGNPLNGDTVNHRQETSVTQTTPVIDPPVVTITGTVWDDANGSGTATFTNIKDGSESFANTTGSTPPLQAILVDSNGKVLDSKPVSTVDGTYSLSTLGVQSGVSVILVTSTTTYNVGDPAPTTGSLPPGWTSTTPLSYSGANTFSLGITSVTTKDFGIDRLPTANNVTSGTVTTPTGTNTTPVPTLTGSDPEDTSIAKFRILTLPDPTTQGTLYYDGTAITSAGFLITNPALLTFDPVDTATGMSFTYAAVDNASKESASATATITFNATAVTIDGTVWNDFDNSALGTFTNIKTGTEAGTNAVFGTTTTPVKAILVNTTTGLVIGTQTLGTNGVYSFTNVPANTNVQVMLSDLAGTPGAAPPTAKVPTGWVNTSPLTTSFNTGLAASTKDFGIRQRAKFVIVKRITQINGFTTNPNDSTDLAGVTTDTFNNAGNWPSNYLVGSTSAGLVKPGDTIQYTIYYLNNQGANATSVKICDPIRGNQTYLANTLQLHLGASTATSLPDSGNTYAAGAAPTNCNVSASGTTGTDNGGIAIGITDQPGLSVIPGATGIGTPTTSYGLFRFTTKVNP